MSVSVPREEITDGPDVQWNHIDGPLLCWAGHLHWLTWRERLAIWTGLRSIEEVASARWPHLANLRRALQEAGDDRAKQKEQSDD